MTEIFFILMGVAMFITVAVLTAGIIGMMRGSEFNAKYSNVLMRWRIIAQFIAVLMFLLGSYLANNA